MWTAEQWRAYRALRKAEGRPLKRGKGGKHPPAKWPPLRAYLDGEATEVGYNCLQIYVPESTTHTVWVPDRSLTTAECLSALYAVPKRIFFGYGLRYDISNWLDSLPIDAVARLRSVGKAYYGPYRIDYIPGKCLTIDDRTRPPGDKRRFVYDLLPFWQCAYVAALKSHGIEVPPIIAEMKALRGSFRAEDRETILAYNEAELQTMEVLHGKLCEILEAGGLKLRTWFGPGAMARMMCKQRGLSQREDTLIDALQARRQNPRRDEASEPMRGVVDAFYGGRFELSRIGPVDRCWEYDLASAYPWAMAQGMPCFACGGEWRAASSASRASNPTSTASSPWTVYQAAWRPRRGQRSLVWGPFPYRSERYLAWTTDGEGWYHAAEVEAALRYLGDRYEIDVLESWSWHPACDHDPFDWVGPLARERVAIKHINPGRAQCLKLALNSCYGILADKAGVARGRKPMYHNPYWAGLITARTRARLIEASAAGWNDIIYLATDGVHSAAPLSLATGSELGDWEPPTKAGIPAVFLGPGCYLYEDAPRGKSRGISLNALPPDLDYWRDLYARTRSDDGFDLTLNRFVGIYEARARACKQPPENYRALVNTWHSVTRRLNYNLEPRRVRAKDGRWLAASGGYWQAMGHFLDQNGIVEDDEWTKWQPEWSDDYGVHHA